MTTWAATFRSSSAARASTAFLTAPVYASTAFFTACASFRTGSAVDVITHEMGHVIGIGTVWEEKGLLTGAGTNNPRFTGAKAKKAFGELKGQVPTAVPVENTGGAGTRDSHWRETVFKNELMSGFIAAPGNPLSKLTVAQLADLGYVVDMDAAEPYKLPNLADLAERGLLIAAPNVHAHALPILAPKVLPDASLV